MFAVCLYLTHTCCFANGQPNDDEGVGDRGNRRDSGQQPSLMKIRDLTQDNLDGSKDQHELIVGGLHVMHLYYSFKLLSTYT